MQNLRFLRSNLIQRLAKRKSFIFCVKLRSKLRSEKPEHWIEAMRQNASIEQLFHFKLKELDKKLCGVHEAVRKDYGFG